jgi:acetylornithine deacetylase/succinyl-diaminopimelate desuccinylase-like protein
LQLITRNRGGHGSRPRPDNAIYELTAAVDRIAKLKFPVVLNDVTRAQFIAMSKLESGQAAVDMQHVAQDPPDSAAVDRLSKDPFYNALLRTTCVATMLKAGHGPSALPQRAEATINCRIVPGQTSAWLMNTLREAIADDGVVISWQFNEPSDPPASPLRPDVFSAAKKGVVSFLFADHRPIGCWRPWLSKSRSSILSCRSKQRVISVGCDRHFFSSAGQLVTIVRGTVLVCSKS